MEATLTRPNKSTNVRPSGLSLFAAGVRAVGTVRPALAAELMLKTFCTPRRVKGLQWKQGLVPEHQRISVEGEDLALYRWGPALNGKKVLLAHGWSGSSEQLRALVEPLREKGFAVYAFDQAAHGQSTGKTTNLPRFARALRAVSDHLGPVHAVVAHSLGASAAAFAIAHGLPVERLVMVAPPAHPRNFITAFWRSLGLPDALGERMYQLIEQREGMALRDLDLPQLALDVRSPVLVVHDRNDCEVPFSEGEQWSRTLPHARLLSTDGLGHNRVLAAASVAEAITAFVA